MWTSSYSPTSWVDLVTVTPSNDPWFGHNTGELFILRTFIIHADENNFCGDNYEHKNNYEVMNAEFSLNVQVNKILI